jgi:hypothetical protein
MRFDEHPSGADHPSFKHGHNMANSPTYVSWQSMLRRVRGQHGYADRGITVDPRWQSFENFLADMGERPAGATIDRIDNDGPYAPDNCRWASNDIQFNNKTNSRHITYDGRTQTVAQWAREVGLSRGVLYNRIFLLRWDLKRALETPVSSAASPKVDDYCMGCELGWEEHPQFGRLLDQLDQADYDS